MVPFNDLRRRTEASRPALEQAFQKTLRGKSLILGESVADFEAAFAAYCGTAHAVGVASGTDAIWISLAALGIGKGDEVVTVANTCAPTIVAILRTGATPVLVDVDEGTLTMDPERAAAACGKKTKALLPVHLYGQCADLDTLKELATRKSAALVEDCAQAHGAAYKGRKAGATGAFGAFSFYPTKNLGCLGDGGLVTTDDDGLAEKVRLLRHYGYKTPNVSSLPGYNSRLDELQAAFLLPALSRLDAGNARRAEIAARYRDALADTKISPVEVAPWGEPVYHLFVVRSSGRDALRDRLKAAGIGTAVHYPVPIHRQEGLAGLCRIGKGGLARSERAAEEILSLPMFPEMTDAEVDAVCRALSGS